MLRNISNLDAVYGTVLRYDVLMQHFFMECIWKEMRKCKVMPIDLYDTCVKLASVLAFITYT